MLDGISETRTRNVQSPPPAKAVEEAPAPAAAAPEAPSRAAIDPAAQRDARNAQAGREREAAAKVPAAPDARARPIPKLDPNKPVMIVATQSGGADSNRIVKATDEYMKDQAQKNGFQVVDASNLSGAALEKHVADVVRANPAAFAGKNTVLFGGGHGSIVTNADGKDRHELNASEEDGRNRSVETVRDVVKPVFDGIKRGTGEEQKLSTFLSSCRAGEAAQDVKEVFGDNKNVGLLASSSRDQNSYGPGKAGIEQAAIAFTKSMATASKDRASADEDKDGALSIGEFAKHWNERGGGLGFVDPTKDGEGPLVKRQQKLVVGGNADLALVDKGTGAARDTSAEGLQDPKLAGPLQRDDLDATAKRMQREMEEGTGRKPDIAPGFSTVHETGAGKKKVLPDGSVERRVDGVTETQRKDGSFDVALPDGGKIHFAPDGTRTDKFAAGNIAERTVNPNTGRRDIRYRDGHREVREADGSGFIEKNGKRTTLPVKPSETAALPRLPKARLPEGEPKSTTSPGGDEIERWDDGTTLTTTKDGKETLELPGPSPISRSTIDMKANREKIELRSGPIASVERPLESGPGTTTTTYRDGTREVRSEDGRGHFVLKDGSRVKLPIR